MFRRILPWCGVAVVLATAIPAIAAGPDTIDAPASALAGAVPTTPVATDVVTVYNSGSLDDSVASSAFAAARDAGGTAAIGRSAAIGMRRVLRSGVVVQAAQSGYAFPMSISALPNGVVGRVMGREVSAVLSSDTIVMSALTAGLRGALAGDQVELVASSGAIVTLTIGAVVDDAITGGTELLMSLEAADRLGIGRLSRVVIWGFESRAALDQALANRGLISTSIRVRRSWDPFDPDLTLGYSRTKESLGEFAYRVNSNGSVSLDSWESANITYGSVGQFPYRLNLPTGCHQTVRISLEAAMAEAIVSGVADSINYFHANTAGGCFVRRFNRLTPNSAIGFLSRHTWGMAIDTNTIGSCQGCAPPDFVTHPHGCDLVRIFRKHGFAWGGNFLTPDGMHFEWVGEPRDQFDYPSRYCPNIVSGAPPGRPAGESQAVEETARATLFATDGFDLGD